MGHCNFWLGEKMGSKYYVNICRYSAVVVFFVGVVLLSSANFAVAQSTKYDGVYSGSQTLSEEDSKHNYSKCLKGPFKRKLVVSGGAATYTYNPTYEGQVTGTVSADGDVIGTVATSSGGVSLSGKIEGGAFTGEVWSIICTYSLQLKRVP